MSTPVKSSPQQNLWVFAGFLCLMWWIKARRNLYFRRHSRTGITLPSILVFYTLYTRVGVSTYDQWLNLPMNKIQLEPVLVQPSWCSFESHTLGMVAFIINSINTPYIITGYLGQSPFKGLLLGVKQLGYRPKGATIFPMIIPFWKAMSKYLDS